MGGRRFSGNYSDFRAYEDSTEVAQRRKQSRKKDWKQNNRLAI
jgi:ATP-binding cassette subfamily F protein uup